MKKVKIFVAAECPQCDETEKYLKSRSVDFEEIDLTSNKQAAADLAAKTGYSVLPQIQIDGQFIVGFDRQKLDEMLEKN